MKTKLVAKAILVNDEGQILVLRRSGTDTIRPGSADFPGGGVEESESMLEAVVREIQEEAGIDVDPGQLEIFYARTDEPNLNGDIIVRILFAGKVHTNNVQLSFEHDEYQWLSPEAALSKFDSEVWQAGLKFAIKHQLLNNLA